MSLSGDLPVDAGTEKEIQLAGRADISPPIYVDASRCSLVNVGLDYVILSHGLLFAHLGLSDPYEDPVLEYFARSSAVSNIGLRMTFQSPLVDLYAAGLGIVYPKLVDWSRIVTLIPRQDWAEVSNMLMDTLILDRKAGILARIGLAELDLQLARTGTETLPISPASIKVVVLGLDTNKGVLEFGPQPQAGCPAPLRWSPARENTLSLYNKLIKDDLSDFAKLGPERLFASQIDSSDSN